MCIKKPIRVPVSDEPIVAYKVMYISKEYYGQDTSSNVKSIYAGNEYLFGIYYRAEFPANKDSITPSKVYDKGFHSYRLLEHAKRDHNYRCRKKGVLFSYIVKVEIRDILFMGKESGREVYVSDSCKFIEIIKD